MAAKHPEDFKNQTGKWEISKGSKSSERIPSFQNSAGDPALRAFLEKNQPQGWVRRAVNFVFGKKEKKETQQKGEEEKPPEEAPKPLIDNYQDIPELELKLLYRSLGSEAEDEQKMSDFEFYKEAIHSTELALCTALIKKNTAINPRVVFFLLCHPAVTVNLHSEALQKASFDKHPTTAIRFLRTGKFPNLYKILVIEKTPFENNFPLANKLLGVIEKLPVQEKEVLQKAMRKKFEEREIA
ncbi:MAG: hypothetical protein Q8O95_03005 [bacterium]|nr:hypothetical protein [bacterium]